MQLQRNLLAGLLNSIWTALATFAVVPFYIDYLGIEAYGVIGFFITLQGVFLLLDLGLSPTVSREFAKHNTDRRYEGVAIFMHSIAVAYWLLAAAIVVFFLIFAGAIADRWLHATDPDLTSSGLVLLMGISVASRFPHSIYRGALIGAEKLVLLNSINMLMVTVTAVGSVLVLALVDASLQAFLIWQVVCGLLLTALMHRAAWRLILPAGRRPIGRLRFDRNVLIKVWRFTAGLTLVSIAGVILLQLDKLVLSAMLPLQEFGVYMLAVLAGSVFSAFFMPVFNVIYPRMTSLAESGDTEQLKALYRNGTRILGMVLFPLAMVIGLFSEPLVAIWTGDAQLASQARPLIFFIAVGFAINGVMHFPYALQLAYGRAGIALQCAVLVAIILIPLIFIMVAKYGAVGGAASWLIIQIVYLLTGCWLTHRHLLRGTGLYWLLGDVGIPVIASVLVGISVSSLLTSGPLDVVQSLCWSAVSGVTVLALALLASPVFYPYVRDTVSRVRNRTSIEKL
jgi:O-antigen/teichoic acid export membrane protein